MYRSRECYLQLHPELGRIFRTSHHDDLPGALVPLGLGPSSAPTLGTDFHGFVTLPGMVSVIVASVGAAIAGLAATGFGASAYVVLLVGALAFASVLAVMLRTGNRSFRGYGPSSDVRFPTPRT